MPEDEKQTQTSDAPNDGSSKEAQSLAAQIADSEPSFDGLEDKSDAQKATSEDGNSSSKEKTPVDGQLAEKVDETANKQDDEKKEQQNTVQDDKTKQQQTTEDKTKEKPAPEKNTILDDELFVLSGLEKPVEQNLDYFKNKYSESSKEAKILKGRTDLIQAVLKERGIDLVETAEGLKLKANEKYLNEVSEKDIPNVFKELSKEDQELVDEDVAKKIAKLVAGKLVEARPKVDKEIGQAVLPQHEVDSAFREMADRKFPDGRQVFQDISDPEVSDAMRKLYEHDSFANFRKFANENSDNFKVALNLLHGAAYRVLAPARIARKNAEAQKITKQKENERKLSTAPAIAGQTQNTATPKKRDIAKEIAESDDEASAFFRM